MVQNLATTTTITNILTPQVPPALTEEDRRARSEADWAAIRADEEEVIALRAVAQAEADEAGPGGWMGWAEGWDADLDADLFDLAMDLDEEERAEAEEEDGYGLDYWTADGDLSWSGVH